MMANRKVQSGLQKQGPFFSINWETFWYTSVVEMYEELTSLISRLREMVDEDNPQKD